MQAKLALAILIGAAAGAGAAHIVRTVTKVEQVELKELLPGDQVICAVNMVSYTVAKSSPAFINYTAPGGYRAPLKFTMNGKEIPE